MPLQSPLPENVSRDSQREDVSSERYERAEQVAIPPSGRPSPQPISPPGTRQAAPIQGATSQIDRLLFSSFITFIVKTGCLYLNRHGQACQRRARYSKSHTFASLQELWCFGPSRGP
jgi:hypothetical protein